MGDLTHSRMNFILKRNISYDHVCFVLDFEVLLRACYFLQILPKFSLLI